MANKAVLYLTMRQRAAAKKLAIIGAGGGKNGF
jgi:hypothetical protein